jgi:hypothetical protein
MNNLEKTTDLNLLYQIFPKQNLLTTNQRNIGIFLIFVILNLPILDKLLKKKLQSEYLILILKSFLFFIIVLILSKNSS